MLHEYIWEHLKNQNRKLLKDQSISVSWNKLLTSPTVNPTCPESDNQHRYFSSRSCQINLISFELVTKRSRQYGCNKCEILDKCEILYSL